MSLINCLRNNMRVKNKFVESITRSEIFQNLSTDPDVKSGCDSSQDNGRAIVSIVICLFIRLNDGTELWKSRCMSQFL